MTKPYFCLRVTFQTILLMLGSPASPRKRPFELLSDLVDDGGFGEDLHPERWDVSALDEMTHFTKLGLGFGGELLTCSEVKDHFYLWSHLRFNTICQFSVIIK